MKKKKRTFSPLAVKTAKLLGLRGSASLDVIEDSLCKAAENPREHHRRHARKFLLVSFIGEDKLTMQIFSNDPKGLNLTIQEILAATGQVFPSVGPFTVAVADPGKTITVTAGSPDNTTPTNFKPNGTAAVGTVTVTVTDTSNNLVGTGSFDVVAPVAAKADTLNVGFVAAP
jgi:hypothetical protein